MFILFKKYVHGGRVSDHDYIMAIDNYESNVDKASNLAQYLFNHQDF